MEESFFEKIGYFIAFMVLVAPRLIRFLLKSGLARKLLKKLVDALLKKAGSEIREQIEKKLFSEPKTKKTQLETKLFEEEESYLSLDELREFAEESEKLSVRAEEVWNLSLIRTQQAKKLAPEIEVILVNPIRVLSKRLQELVETEDLLQWSEGQRVKTSLGRYRKLLDLISPMVDMRIHPRTEEMLGLLDKAGSECLKPYLDHAARMRLSYPTRTVVTLLGDPSEEAVTLLEGEPIAPVFVREKSARIPRAWVNIASDVYLDVLHSTKGLQRNIVSDLGVMPAPVTLSHYGDERAFISGLLGGMLPRVFADVCSAVLLGPAFAAGLGQWFGQEQDQSNALLISIGGETRSIAPPLHARMFVAVRVLQHLGFTEEATSLFEKWDNQLDSPKTFTVEEVGGRNASVSAQSILGALGRIVDYLMTHPNQAFGNFSIMEIPGLVCDKERWERMLAVAEDLLRGETVNVPGYVVIGAAQVAAEKSSTLEQRIVTGSLESLKNEEAELETTSMEREFRVGFYDSFREKEFLTRAIVAGAALAPRTARVKTNRR